MLAVHEEAASARDFANAALHRFLPAVPGTIEIEDDEGNSMVSTTSKASINSIVALGTLTADSCV